MLFEFNVKMTDDDYFKFNEFWLIRSHYGRSQMVKMRILFTVVSIIACAVFLLDEWSTSDLFILGGAYIFVIVLFQIFFNKFMALCLKQQIKTLKKKGKMGYPPESLIQFNDDVIVETTPTEKTERSYSSLERVSVIGDKTLYIHFNNVMAAILPSTAFVSEEQYESFLAFIKTKCENIDVY